MVESAKPTPVIYFWRGLLIAVLILTVVVGFWAFHGVEAPDGLRPAMYSASQASMILFFVAAGACAVIALWDRARQTGPESEREISLEAFSDIEKGWVRPLLARLVMTSLILQTGFSFVPALLTLIDQRAWLKAFAGAPIVLLLAWTALAPYPALIGAWRKRKARA